MSDKPEDSTPEPGSLDARFVEALAKYGDSVIVFAADINVLVSVVAMLQFGLRQRSGYEGMRQNLEPFIARMKGLICEFDPVFGEFLDSIWGSEQ